jgi:hypothetical protein
MEKTELIQDEFKLFPNPVENKAKLFFDEQWKEQILSIEIFNPIGQLLQKTSNIDVNEIDLTEFPQAEYLLIRIIFKYNNETVTEIIKID